MSKLYNRILFPVWAAISRLRETVYCLEQKGHPTAPVCVYSTFLENGVALRSHVPSQLKCYQDLGFTNILVITSPVPVNKEAQKKICESVRAEVAILIFRPNHGFDFYSWKRGLSHGAVIFGARPAEVLFTNDSILGPLFNLSVDVDWLRKSDETFQLKGLTRSDEIAPHIQSYFLYFNRTLCSKGVLDLWAQRIKAYCKKEDVIGFYEVGGSQYLQERGVELLERYPLVEKQNPTLYAWKELIQSHKFPFFKKSLLTFHRKFLNTSELKSVLADLERDPEVNQEAVKQIQAEAQKNLEKL